MGERETRGHEVGGTAGRESEKEQANSQCAGDIELDMAELQADKVCCICYEWGESTHPCLKPTL